MNHWDFMSNLGATLEELNFIHDFLLPCTSKEESERFIKVVRKDLKMLKKQKIEKMISLTDEGKEELL